MVDISLITIVHILVGSITVISGTFALGLEKGTPPHKFSGQLFVCSMVLMGPIVAAGAWLNPGSISSLGILFVFFIIYLVVSAWSSIHHSEGHIGEIEVFSPFAALAVIIAGIALASFEMGVPVRDQSAPPLEAYFFFSTLAFVAMIFDIYNLKKGGVRGKHRIIRHVWRMNCALFFAISSLFTGPGSIVFPETFRSNPIMVVPQLSILIISVGWIYRLLLSKGNHFKSGVIFRQSKGKK